MLGLGVEDAVEGIEAFDCEGLSISSQEELIQPEEDAQREYPARLLGAVFLCVSGHPYRLLAGLGDQDAGLEPDRCTE